MISNEMYSTSIGLSIQRYVILLLFIYSMVELPAVSVAIDDMINHEEIINVTVPTNECTEVNCQLRLYQEM